MIVKKEDIEFTLNPYNDGYLIVHTVPMIIVDSLTGFSNADLLNTMLHDKKHQRQSFLTYAADPYLMLKKVSTLPNFNLLMVVGFPGSGKTYSISGLLADDKGNKHRNTVNFQHENKIYNSIYNPIYVNIDNKKFEEKHSNYLYNGSYEKPETNHVTGITAFEHIFNFMNFITYDSEDKKTLENKTFLDRYGRKYKNKPIYHRFVYSDHVYFTLFAHLEETITYTTNSDNEKIPDFTKQSIKVFGNMFNRLDFQALTNTLYVIDPVTRKMRVEKGSHKISRCPMLYPKSIDNNLWNFYTHICEQFRNMIIEEGI